MDRRRFLGVTGSSIVAGLAGGNLAELLAQAPNAATGPVVETRSGRIRGLTDQGVRIFRGVPYGDPTGGANRFMPPKPATPWTGVRDATAYGPRGFQPVRPMIPEIGDALTGSGPMGEDCLRLNVWTPAT